MELKPCPFDNGVAEHLNGGAGHFISCRRCGCRTPMFGSEESFTDLAETWNRRVLAAIPITEEMVEAVARAIMSKYEEIFDRWPPFEQAQEIARAAITAYHAELVKGK